VTHMKKLILLVIVLLWGCIDEPDNGIDIRPFEEQKSIDIAAIDAYLMDNGITALQHSSGIRYEVVNEGTVGDKPTLDDNVTVSYTGRFFNGQIFDQTTDGESISFGLTNLIESWQIMIPEMNVGSTIIIYAPSVYCYGFRGSFGIPPNTNLIFEIELVSIN